MREQWRQSSGGVALRVGRVNEESDLFRIETDTAKDVDVCKPPACDRLGYDGEDEVLGRPCVNDVVAAEGQDAVKEALDKAMDGEAMRVGPSGNAVKMAQIIYESVLM